MASTTIGSLVSLFPPVFARPDGISIATTGLVGIVAGADHEPLDLRQLYCNISLISIVDGQDGILPTMSFMRDAQLLRNLADDLVRLLPRFRSPS